MSSSPRVTESSVRTRIMTSLQRNMNRTQNVQDQISSGKQLNRPSDSPTGTVSALQLRGEVRANRKYSTNADDAMGRLGIMQDTLQNAYTIGAKVRELALAATSGGQSTPEANRARGVEVDNLKGTMLQFANTKFLERPIFGGATPESTAYDTDGTYKGSPTGAIHRSVGPNAQVRVEVRGPEAFGEGDTQVFKVLNDLSEAMKNNDTKGMDAGLKNLDKSLELMKSTLSDVGARYNRVTQMKQSAEDRLMSVSSQLSDIEDVDLPKAIMELQLQQTSYQAALAATAKVIQPSLIDFLR